MTEPPAQSTIQLSGKRNSVSGINWGSTNDSLVATRYPHAVVTLRHSRWMPSNFSHVILVLCSHAKGESRSWFTLVSVDDIVLPCRKSCVFSVKGARRKSSNFAVSPKVSSAKSSIRRTLTRPGYALTSSLYAL